jgi:hypothetical protein
MTEYQKGFLEALQAICIMGEGKQKCHMSHVESKELSENDQESAFNCAIVLGQFIADIKLLASQVHRGQLEPEKIATVNGTPYWWATEEGKGKS